MRNKLLITLCLAVAAMQLSAQPLRQDPNLVSGRLDNGLTYYIYPGTKPEGKATYRLFIKSGSLYENEQQLGLAHFLEHMAFNGSDDFPNGSLVPELQEKGAGFGSDINAHTAMNETVYKLTLPSKTPAALDSALMVLENWAGRLTLDQAAIDKERGIIISEWFTRTGPATEVSRAFLTEILNGSRYSDRQVVIGDTTIIRNFKREELKDYYDNWYNPRLMAVAVTGDIDAANAERIIAERFSDIRAPKIKVPNYEVDNYKRPEFNYVQHETVKTNEFNVIQLIDDFPGVDDEKSYFPYLQRTIINRLFAERFNSIARTNPGYKSASGSVSSLMNIKAVVLGSVELKEGQPMEGIREFAQYYEQIFRYGFLQSEIDKVAKSYMGSMKRSSDAADSKESSSMIEEMYAMFYGGNGIITPQEEYGLAEKYIGRIDSASVAKALRKLRKPRQTHYFLTCNEDPSTLIPSETEVLALFDSLANAEIEPYIKTIRTFDSLLDEEPEGRQIVKKEAVDSIGAQMYYLSNGARVIFKYSDNSKQRVNLSAVRQGGISALDSLDFVNANFAGSVIALSGAGKFSADELSLFMAGSSASARFLIDRNRTGIVGAAGTEDLEQMFQLLYLKWCYPKIDNAALELYKTAMFDRNKEQFKRESDIFGLDMSLMLNGDNYMTRPMTDERINAELDPDRLLPVFNLCFGSAQGYDFILVGDTSEEEIEPLIEKYIGALPSGDGSAVQYKYMGPQILHSDTILVRSVGDNPRASVALYYQNDEPMLDMRRTQMVGDVASAIVRTKLLASLREELNMVYSVGASASLTGKPSDLNRFVVSFACDPKDVDTLIERTMSDLKGMVDDPSQFADDLADVKLNETKKYESGMQANLFWSSGLREALYYDHSDWEYLISYDKLLESVTVEEIAEYIDNYIFNSPQLKAVLLPKETTDQQD
jgi:predicted Zn-dependent peptidase